MERIYAGKRRPILLIMALIAMTSCAGPKIRKSTDQLVYRIPNYAAQHWKIVTMHNDDPGSVSVRRIKESDTEAQWQEMVISESHDKHWGGQLVEQALAALQQRREKACQKSFEWKILAQAPTSIIYEGRAKACSEQEPEYELGRIFDGQTTRFRLAYLSQDPNVPPDQRAKWLLMLQEAATR
jgi:hypothetical protein